MHRSSCGQRASGLQAEAPATRCAPRRRTARSCGLLFSDERGSPMRLLCGPYAGDHRPITHRRRRVNARANPKPFGDMGLAGALQPLSVTSPTRRARCGDRPVAAQAPLGQQPLLLRANRELSSPSKHSSSVGSSNIALGSPRRKQQPSQQAAPPPTRAPARVLQVGGSALACSCLGVSLAVLSYALSGMMGVPRGCSRPSVWPLVV